MTIHFDYEIKEKIPFDEQKLITAIVEKALEQELCPYETEINIIFTTDEEIQQINKEYRNIDAPTDVLSFPMIQYEQPSNFEGLEERPEEYFNLETGELLLGDIILSLDRAKVQAEQYGHSLEREIGFLTAHSILHLFGYDHMESQERDVMEQKQEAILHKLGIVRT